jgi:hypothetical protein
MFLAQLDQDQMELLYHLAYSIVVSDGEFTAEEELSMMAMRREMALPEDFEPHYLEVKGLEQKFLSHRSRIIVIIALTHLGYVDGAFEIEEKSYLHELCQVFNISDELFARINNWVRRLVALHEEATNFL